MSELLAQIEAARLAGARRAMSHAPQRPVGAREMADAAQMVGLLSAPIPVLGDVAGLLGDAAMYATKPEERTWSNAALTALGALPFVPPAAGAAKKGLLDMSDAARAKRMAEQGYTTGMWRGGAGVADGPHFTPDPKAAAAFGARHGDKADVREYALRMGRQFDANGNFGPDDLKRLADILGAAPFNNRMAAKELPTMASDYRSGAMPGGALWQVLQTQSGGNAQDVLRAAGYDTINAGQEVIVLKPGNVRDAKRATFDPRHVGKVGPFLGVAGVGLLGLGAENDDSSK